jgi:hypothetical protein
MSLEIIVARTSIGTWDVIGEKHCHNGNDAFYGSYETLEEALNHNYFGFIKVKQDLPINGRIKMYYEVKK